MMADPQSPQPNAQGQMLAAFTSLTRQIEQLNAHLRNADTAAQTRARQVTNDQSVNDRSRGTNASWPSYMPGSARSSASTPARVDAVTSEVAAREANQQYAQRTNVGGSTPPDSVTRRTEAAAREDINTPSEGEALTFAMLGAHGGPFGRLRLQQYMLQRNIDWAKNASSAAQDFLDVRALNNLNAGQGVGTFNTLGSRALGGLSGVLDWAQSPRGQWTALAGLSAYRLAARGLSVTNDWRDAGRRLGYGNEQSLGILGFNEPWRQIGATGEGLSLRMEEEGLMGRMPHFLGGNGVSFSGLRKDEAEAAVGTLAAQGFGNQGGYSNWVNGDNTRIAANLLGPLMNMGLAAGNPGQAAAEAAQWTPALRNANTSMQTLMDTLSQLPAAARAAKETVSDFNASLMQTAQNSVSQGGTVQGGMQMGMAFTEATGMAPAIGSTISNNPIYQALMMGQFGVLPSGIPNLPGGAQVQGMLSAFNLLRGATSGLNQNKYETVAGMRLPEVFGYQLQDAQIAQMLGVDQSTVNRLRREAPYASKISQVLGQLGNEGSNGMPGTGIWSILGQAQDWGHLSTQQQRQAKTVWDATAGANIHGLGLTKAQIDDIYSTGNVRTRMSKLQTDLLGAQQNNPQNQITVYVKFKGAAAKHLEQAGPSQIKLGALSGQGMSENRFWNSPLGDAARANNNAAMWEPNYTHTGLNPAGP